MYVFCICTCSAPLSVFHMERRSRNMLIIIIIIIIIIISGAGIAQLIVLGLAVHSVAGLIFLWGHFPVEGIFPLELTWVQAPFPPKLFRMRV